MTPDEDLKELLKKNYNLILSRVNRKQTWGWVRRKFVAVTKKY